VAKCIDAAVNLPAGIWALKSERIHRDLRFPRAGPAAGQVGRVINEMEMPEHLVDVTRMRVPMVKVLTKTQVTIVCLLDALLKEIQEWTAVIWPSGPKNNVRIAISRRSDTLNTNAL
jgi:hypothetical protein